MDYNYCFLVSILLLRLKSFSKKMKIRLVVMSIFEMKVFMGGFNLGDLVISGDS